MDHKNNYFGENGRMKVGTPKLRQLDFIENDPKSMGVEG